MTPETVTEPKLITICGWCPDAQAITKELHMHGYVVSHGICQDCRAVWLSELRPTTRAQA